MVLAAENCGCAYQNIGASVANSPICNGLLLFMTIIESYIVGRCDIAEPCSRITGADDAEEEYDFVVVGGGSAGSIVAARLAEDGRHSVLLIEAGGPEPVSSRVPSFYRNYWNNAEVDWRYRTKPANYCLSENGKGCKWPRGKVLGGTSVLNGMMCIRGHEADFDYWTEFGAEGWTWNDVLPYFLKFERNTQIGSLVSEEYHSSHGIMPVGQFRHTPDTVSDMKEAVVQAGYNIVKDLSNPTTVSGFTVAQAFNYNGQRYTTARAYLQPLADRPNLTILLEALVRKVLIKHNTAYGVEYSKNNQTRRVRAKKEVILSAGAINSPQLLMLSGIGPQETLDQFNIPVVADLPVGQNLRNHVGVTLYFILEKEENRQKLDWNVTTEYLLKRNGPMSSTGITQFTGILYSSLANRIQKQPDLQFFFNGFYAECSANGTIGELVSCPGDKMNISANAVNLLPRSVGYMTLQSDDPTVPLLMDPGYFQHPDDMIIIKDAMQVIKNITESDIFQNKYGIKLDSSYSACDALTTWSDEWMECMILQYTDPQNHQAGTAAISTVVDTTLKVYGVNGLRVIDGSVMPIQVTGNPQASIMMVAERGADFVRKEWSRTHRNHRNRPKRHVGI